MAKVQTLQRYDQRPNLDMVPDEDGEYMLAEEVLAIFPPNVAYMPVPRCDQCRYWDGDRSTWSQGRCALMGSPEREALTSSAFGCVLWAIAESCLPPA